MREKVAKGKLTDERWLWQFLSGMKPVIGKPATFHVEETNMDFSLFPVLQINCPSFSNGRNTFKYGTLSMISHEEFQSRETL